METESYSKDSLVCAERLFILSIKNPITTARHSER